MNDFLYLSVPFFWDRIVALPVRNITGNSVQTQINNIKKIFNWRSLWKKNSLILSGIELRYKIAVLEIVWFYVIRWPLVDIQ
jgi:hypothetical protein